MLYRSYLDLNCRLFHIKNCFLLLILFLSLFFQNNALAENQKSENFFVAEYSECHGLNADLLSLKYQRLETDHLSLGYSSKDYCLKVSFNADQISKVIEPVFYLTSYQLMAVEVVQIDAGKIKPVSKFDSRLTAIKASGLDSYYFLIRTHHNIDTKLHLVSEQQFKTDESKFTLLLVFYIGFVLALIVYNLSIGISTKSTAYLLYSLFSFSFLLTSIVINGVVDYYFFKELNYYLIKHLMFFSSLSLLSATLFTYTYLQIKNMHQKYLQLIFKIVFLLGLFFLIMSFFVEQNRSLFWIGQFIDMTIVMGLLYFISVSIVQYRNGLNEAIYYLMSWLFVIVSVVVWLFYKKEYFLIFGNAAELITLSLGLAYRINRLNIEKNIAEQNVLFLSKYKRLLKVISHDVSNAMTIIKLVIRKAKQNTQMDEKAILNIQKIDNSANKIIEILNTVKAEESLHLSADGLQLIDVNLKDCVYKCIRIFDDLLELKNIKIHVLINEGDSVHADPAVLSHQILGNLISNAIKFSNVGQHIIIKFYIKDRKKIIEVKDHGVGIAEDKINEIFFSDNQITSNGTQGESGTGYGSSIVTHYVKAMGANLRVESKMAQSNSQYHGTTIKIEFPFK